MKVLYAMTTEKAVGAMDRDNTLTFVVENNATKTEIRKEIEASWGEKVAAVNTVRAMDGRKKAVVHFSKKGAASELASKLKLI